jgi:F-type H+-transporting ATPase subunit delta
MTGAVARRYAKAVFALAKETGVLQPAGDELARLAALAIDPTVGPVLGSPVLSGQRRAQLVDLLVRELRLSDLLARFLKLLAEHQRLRELPGICEYYQRLLDVQLGRVRITIRSARPLAPAQQQQLVASFATLTKKDVIPTVRIDPELLGGVLVEVDDKVYDGSVRTQLERLAKELTGAASSL